MNYFENGLDDLPPICQSYKDKHFEANDWTKCLEFVEDKKAYMTQVDLYSMINGNTTCKLSPNELNETLEKLGAVRKRKCINGKKVYIGSFKTEEEAHLAYVLSVENLDKYNIYNLYNYHYQN